MGLYQSFNQVFVTNTSSLLAAGNTVDQLAVGQIGILDAKTYLGVTAPTYAKNKALLAVWGTPDVYVGDFAGMPNENEYSKIIKGKLIRRFRAKKAQRGQTPIYTVGWSGSVSDTDTISFLPGESKNLYVKLTGTVIDRLYSNQGITKVFKNSGSVIADCDDACTSISALAGAREIVDQMVNDKDFRKFIRVGILQSPTSSATTQACYTYLLTVCDDGTDGALGAVQGQYTSDKVRGIDRIGAYSTYQIIKDAHSTPSAFTQGGVFVPNCASCPAGYTLTASAVVLQVRTASTVDATAIHAAFTAEVTVTAVSTSPQFNIFLVTFATTADITAKIAEAVAAGYEATNIGINNQICTLDTPVSTAWVEDTTVTRLRQEKDYTLTVADTTCGSNRLVDLQAAYPDLTVAVVSASGSCAHTFTTTTLSDCYIAGCAVDTIVFNAPAVFEGQSWTPAADEAGDADTLVGIQIESAFFNMRTNECTFDAFPYENDVVHVQISNHNPDFNADPNETEWAVKQIRQVKYPQGHGAYVQHLEKESKGYDQRDRNWDPVVREVQGYSLQADPAKFYDQYVLEFDTKFKTPGGWAADTTQSFNLTFFVAEGTGAAIETAFNTYLTSAGIEEDGAVV